MTCGFFYGSSCKKGTREKSCPVLNPISYENPILNYNVFNKILKRNLTYITTIEPNMNNQIVNPNVCIVKHMPGADEYYVISYTPLGKVD